MRAPIRPVTSLLAMLACTCTCTCIHAQESPAPAPAPVPALPMPRVEVIGTSPLPGLQAPLPDVPAGVQVFKGAAIERQQHDNLAAFLGQNASSVTLGAAQGNPYQPDLNFRGFTASPLLG